MKKFIKYLSVFVLAFTLVVVLASCDGASHTHSWTQWEIVKEATCVEDGEKTRYCTDCEKVDTRRIVATGRHTVEWVEEVAPTCEETGVAAHFECTQCHQAYEAKNGKVEVEAETLVLAALGHDYQFAGFVWAEDGKAAQAKFVCSRDAEHVELHDATITSEVTVAPTCEGMGTTTYTATYETYSDTLAVVDVEETGHNYVFAEFVWNESNTSAQAKLVCANDASHVELVDAVMSSEVTTEATYTSNGATTYTATYGEHTDSKAVAISSHKLTGAAEVYSAWTVDHRSGYTFAYDAVKDVYVSNNTGKNSSSSYFDVTFTKAGTAHILWTVSSESGWDKFTAYHYPSSASVAVVNAVSGENNGEIVIEISAEQAANGYRFTFMYSKDSSGAKGSDCATLQIYFVNSDVYSQYELAFEANGGNAVAPQTVWEDAAIAMPEAVKEGYFFDGWFADAELTVAFDSEAGISENTTVYAKYTKGLQVTFANTGDTVVEGLLVRPNQAVAQPSVTPVKNDNSQYFAYWAVSGVEFDFAAGVTVDTVVEAVWRDPVVLTFDVDGGSAVEAISTDINVAITMPANPTKEGYRFDGWFNEKTFDTAYNGEALTENKTVYAKWVQQVTVTYYEGTEVKGTDVIDINTQYTPTTPATITDVVEAWCTDTELNNAFENGTAVTADLALYAKKASLFPAGVVESFVTVTETGSKLYAFNYDANTGWYTSTNAGVSSSNAKIVITFAKQSFVSMTVETSSESNYDYFKITQNGTQIASTKVSGQNGVLLTNSYAFVFEAGDVVELIYTKDSSGNHGTDTAIIKDLIINDGIPAVTVTFDYALPGVENATAQVEINSSLSTIENFASYAPAETDARHFGGWYYDAELTQPVDMAAAVLKDTTLYAKHVYPATITFINEDEQVILESIQVWTNVPVELPEAPHVALHAFQYWMTLDYVQFDATKGVSGDTTLVAVYELLPAGATTDEGVVLVAELTNGAYSSGTITTTEKYQTFYAKFTAPATDRYYFTWDTSSMNIAGGTTTSKYYSRYTIYNEDMTVFKSAASADSNIVLELTADTTYYFAFNMASGSYTAWGTSDFSLVTSEQDTVAEAKAFAFGTTEELPGGSFASRNALRVYAYEATATESIKLAVTSTGWCSVSVYNSTDFTLANRMVYQNVSSTTVAMELSVVEDIDYYIVISVNWTGNELLTKTISLTLEHFGTGYTPADPFALTMATSTTVSFVGGPAAYYAFTLDEASTVLFDMKYNGYGRTFKVFADSDLANAVATYSINADKAEYLDLAAGNYVVKVTNNSTIADCSFTATIMAANQYWTTATEVALADAIQVNAEFAPTYYTFTTGEDMLWHFFSVEGATVSIYTESKTLLGSTALQLAANTTFYLVVTGNGEATINHSTLVTYADGKSEGSAFTYSDETKSLPTDVMGSYDWYYIFTAEAAGTYAFYTLNDSTSTSFDSKGWAYSDADFSDKIGYNDDGGSSLMNPLGAHRYNFYFELALEAGQTVYVEVTYSIYSSNQGQNCQLVIAALN